VSEEKGQVDSFASASDDETTRWVRELGAVGTVRDRALEVSTKLGRHFWQRSKIELDSEGWEHLADRFGMAPEDHALRREFVEAVRNAVDDELSDHQRRVFVAIVVDCVPVEALAISLGSNRNAIYKTMYDARRKLRAALVAKGYLDASPEGGGLENVNAGVSE
jgi:RNA polymerase sigma-70 factor (ECF subfamily)